jgi:hypothetical protein
MNGHSHKPLTEAEIVAAREKAATGGVSWNREQAVRESIARVKAKKAAEAIAAERAAALLALQKRQRRIRTAIVMVAVLMLLGLAWAYLHSSPSSTHRYPKPSMTSAHWTSTTRCSAGRASTESNT